MDGASATPPPPAAANGGAPPSPSAEPVAETVAFLGTGEQHTSRPAHASAQTHPGQVGPHRILQCVGEGGMGVVYKAEQLEPVRRVVALKLIKLGLDTREVVARFEAERQALALMDHPGVAKVYDAGMTEHGRPYFAMEFVSGVPLNRYCDQENLGTRERLELFIQVCQAVQHAHQKGIIHRDLKPGNILVTLVDNRPVPKVIDFGIAKATNPSASQHTLFTRTGGLIGTPLYMSPEQAASGGLDVDTRTDVYSLGVILYELLTGTPPFDPEALRRAGTDQVARVISEIEPHRPSLQVTRLASRRTRVGSPSQSGDGPVLDAGKSDAPPAARPLDRPAGRSAADLRALRRELSVDLDWIVLKAMEKDRARRYESASALAADLRRYLDHEPVTARPPALAYRTAKLVRRHRAAAVATAAVAAGVIAGLAGTTVGMVQAHRQRDRAVAAERAAVLQRQAAERATAEVTAANQFMRDLFTAFANPSAESKRRLSAGARRLDEGWLRDQPQAQDATRMMIAFAYLSQQELTEAGKQFELALQASRVPGRGGGVETSGMCLEGLGLIAYRRNEFGAAERRLREAVAAFRESAKPSADVLNCLSLLVVVRNRLGDTAGARAARLELMSATASLKSAELTDTPADAPLLCERAQVSLRIGRFADAAADLTRATTLAPSFHEAWYLLACSRLYLGDQEGYRSTCKEMVDHLASVKGWETPQIAERTAKACLLAPDPAADVGQLDALADKALASNPGPSLLPWFQMCKGLADYRAGRFTAAADRLAKLSMPDNPTAMLTVRLLGAMSRLRAGDPGAADALRATLDAIDRQLPKPGAEDLGEGPENYLICQVLRREAEEMVSRGSGDRKGQQPGSDSHP